MKNSIKKITETLFKSACNNIAKGQYVEPSLFAVGRFVDHALSVTLEINNPLLFEVTVRQLARNKRPRAVILLCQFYGRQILERRNGLQIDCPSRWICRRQDTGSAC